MYFALENVENHAFSQKVFGKELRFQVSPGTICRSVDMSDVSQVWGGDLAAGNSASPRGGQEAVSQGGSDGVSNLQYLQDHQVVEMSSLFGLYAR